MRLQFQKREIGKPNYPALAAARRRRRKRILHTLKKPTTMPTKLAKESELVLSLILQDQMMSMWTETVDKKADLLAVLLLK
jgi:hypothetical protein